MLAVEEYAVDCSIRRLIVPLASMLDGLTVLFLIHRIQHFRDVYAALARTKTRGKVQMIKINHASKSMSYACIGIYASKEAHIRTLTL